MKKIKDKSFLVMMDIDSRLFREVLSQYNGKPYIESQGEKRFIEVVQTEVTGSRVTCEISFIDEIEKENTKFKSSIELLDRTYSFLQNIVGDFNISINNSNKIFEHMQEISNFIKSNE